MTRIRSALLSGMALLLVAASAQGQAEKSLTKCQKTVGKEVSKYASAYTKTVGKCLDQITKVVVQSGDPIADAASKCAKSFLALKNTAKPDKTIAAKMAAKMAKACDPADPAGKVVHTLADLLGSGAGVTEPLHVSDLGDWCSNYGGDGTIDAYAEWVSCLTEAATCEARQELATKYPRLLEWLASVETEIANLDANCGGSCAGGCTEQDVIDACTALNAVEDAIEGSTEDNLPELSCGPPPATGAVCGNRVIDAGEICDWDDVGSETCTSQLGVESLGALGCAAGCTSYDTSGCQARYEEQNVGGAPTVVDHQTGLEWVVTNDLDSVPDAGDLLDADNTYTWSTGTNVPDGTAFTTYIAGLNGAAYGGHADWRLPSSGGEGGTGPFAPAELESIRDCSFGPPCIDQALFGPTAEADYWSATTISGFTNFAWAVFFGNNGVNFSGKTNISRVRAVRGGL